MASKQSQMRRGMMFGVGSGGGAESQSGVVVRTMKYKLCQHALSFLALTRSVGR